MALRNRVQHTQKSKHKRQTARGFTLVDMLVAMIIISLVFLVFCDLMVMSVRTNKKADLEFIATGVAENRLESIRQRSFGALVTDTTTETVTELPGGQMTVQISPVTGLITNSMRQVQVLVTWTAVGNQATTGGRVRLDSLITQLR